jgi:hypothetical protein
MLSGMVTAGGVSVLYFLREYGRRHASAKHDLIGKTEHF